MRSTFQMARPTHLKLALAVCFAMAASSSVNAGTIHTSDVELGDSWTFSNGTVAFRTESFGQITPELRDLAAAPGTPGTHNIGFFGGAASATLDTGLEIAAGTYTVSGWLGNYMTGFPPVTFTLQSDGASIETYLDSSSGAAAPPAESWANWTRVYVVASGVSEIGKDLDVFVGMTGGHNFAFDGPLTIDFVAIPEPTSILLCSLLGLCLAGFGIRRRAR